MIIITFPSPSQYHRPDKQHLPPNIQNIQTYNDSLIPSGSVINFIARLLYRDTPITLSKDQTGSHANQSIEVRKHIIERNHVHQAQSRARTPKDLTLPQNTKVVALAAVLLINFKHDLGAHARPDHLIELQDRQQSRDRPIVRNIVPVDHIALATDEVPNVSSELPNPHTVTRGTCCQAPRVATVDVRVLVMAQAVDIIGDILSDTRGRVDPIYKLAW